MKISLNWIEEILGTKIEQTPEECSQILLHKGFEVSSIQKYSGCSGVIVAEILEISKHPKADRLRIAKVTDGNETLNVVCGAPNIEVGQKVFWAKVGSKLADGTKIRETAIRDIKSPGMLCSARELGVGEDHSGIWILDKNAKLGSSIDEQVKLEDCFLEIEITPNRADCLSHYGIACEISAALNIKKAELTFPTPTNYNALSFYPVEIENNLDCPRYIAKKIEGISISSSPLLVQTRLIRSGIRPINNIVDITNYAMLETGQPLHAFDADKLEGGKIIVRRSVKDEKIPALDGKAYPLNPDILIIADTKKPVAIAGIMGGEETAVAQTTKNILLESAIFHKGTVRSGRNNLGLSSESSYRFERGVSRWSCLNGSAKAETLICQNAKGRTVSYFDSAPNIQSERPAIIYFSQIEKVLGEKIPVAEVKSIFEKLSISISSADEEKFVVKSPEWRTDLNFDVDYMEEITRLIGYEKIPSRGTQIRLPVSFDKPGSYFLKKKVKNLMQSLGFFESLNYGLTSKNISEILFPQEIFIELENPLSEDQSVLRPTLIIELSKNLKQNIAYQKKEIRLFEIGSNFQKLNGEIVEKTFLGGAACGKILNPSWQTQDPQSIDFYWIKGVIEQLMASCNIHKFQIVPSKKSEGNGLLFPDLSVLLHPLFSFEIKTGEKEKIGEGRSLGYAGLIHPKLAKKLDLSENTVLFEVDFDFLVQKIAVDKNISPVLRTPAIKRDCSIITKEGILWEELLSEIKKTGGELLESCSLFDIYTGKDDPNAKSLSFTLIFRHPEKTLDDDTANQLRDTILSQLNRKFQTELRKK